MHEDADRIGAEPLPREWLPAASPDEASPIWEQQLARMMARAEPALRQLDADSRDAASVWTATFGGWWRAGAALAVAAAALLLLLDPEPVRQPPDAAPLSVLAADGEPVALWQAIGVQADPVLALLALQEETP